jgi:hypothetical protein
MVWIPPHQLRKKLLFVAKTIFPTKNHSRASPSVGCKWSMAGGNFWLNLGILNFGNFLISQKRHRVVHQKKFLPKSNSFLLAPNENWEIENELNFFLLQKVPRPNWIFPKLTFLSTCSSSTEPLCRSFHMQIQQALKSFSDCEIHTAKEACQMKTSRFAENRSSLLTYLGRKLHTWVRNFIQGCATSYWAQPLRYRTRSRPL